MPVYTEDKTGLLQYLHQLHAFGDQLIAKRELLRQEERNKRYVEDEFDKKTLLTAQGKLNSLLETENLYTVDNQGNRIPLLELNYDKENNTINIVQSQNEIAKRYYEEHGDPLKMLLSRSKEDDLTKEGSGVKSSTKTYYDLTKEEQGAALQTKSFLQPPELMAEETKGKKRVPRHYAEGPSPIEGVQVSPVTETEHTKVLSFRDEIQENIKSLHKKALLHDIYTTPQQVRGIPLENPYNTLLGIRTQQLQSYDIIRNATEEMRNRILPGLLFPGKQPGQMLIDNPYYRAGGGSSETNEEDNQGWQEVRGRDPVQVKSSGQWFYPVTWAENKKKGVAYSYSVVQDDLGRYSYKITKKFKWNKKNKAWEETDLTKEELNHLIKIY